jgi:hypothetical protein
MKKIVFITISLLLTLRIKGTTIPLSKSKPEFRRTCNGFDFKTYARRESIFIMR